jgi:TRAP-type mannitol/chloroaromatic compound transport system permease large subunit
LTVVVIGILLAASHRHRRRLGGAAGDAGMPIMLQHHYSKAIASGVVAASGTLGILIPPSIMLVLMADQVSVSVGDLFMGALIPGVAWACCTWSSWWWWASCAARPGATAPGRRDEPLTLRQIGMAFLSTLPTFGLILVVLGSIFFGVATPTEASGWAPLVPSCWRRSTAS